MNFKFDKDTAIIVLIGCLLMAGWLIYLPKYQAKRAAEYQRMLESTQQNAASGTQTASAGTTDAPASGTAQAVLTDAGNTTNPHQAAGEKAAEEVRGITETKTAVLENKLFRVTIDGLTGSVSSVKLTDPRYALKDSGEAIELFREGAFRTFELKSVPALVPVSLDVTMSGPLSAEVVRSFSNGLKLVQTFTLPEDNYMVECKYAWTNSRSEVIQLDLGVRLAGLPQIKSLTGDKIYSERLNVDFCKVGSGNCDSADPQVKSDEKFERRTSCTEPVAWIGSTNKYFASLLFADEAKPFASSNGDRIWRLPDGSKDEKDLYAIPSMTGSFSIVTFAPNVSAPVEFTLKSYCGPKEMARIRALGASVMGVMHISYYSWFEFIARPMVMLLNWLRSICGSYGIAIILLTLIVRALFWPITQKANSSMRRMQKLQPKIKELQEKYKETPMDTPEDVSRKKAELNQKMMELYRVEKVNPVGGCLPVLLQIPVFIALYSALDSAVELRNVPFLWCTDLSRPDLVGPTLPFALPFVGQVGLHPLVIAMTVLMIVQQKMTPTTGDSTQQKMMMLMPVIMLFMFYNLPSGLTLYWTVSNIFSILQMKYGQFAAKRDQSSQADKPRKA